MDNGPGKDGHSETSPVISSLAHACNAAFTKLCQDLPTTDYHGLEAKATDEAGRFKIWAANIGALQRPQSFGSLDSRLKSAERMKSSVVSVLRRLEDALGRANGIALGNLPNRTKSPVIDVESISHSFGLHSGNANEGNHVSSATEIDELFNNIRSCITHLFNLSTLLRRSHPRGRTSRQGPQYSLSDPRPFITNAQDKFPKLKQSTWLAERIGQRNARQIDYIRYRQNHRRNLAQVEVGPGHDEQAERATTKATSFHETLASPESIRRDPLDSKWAESVYTVATSFAQTAVGADNYSGRIVPQLTRLWLDGRQLGYGEPIECPYCRTIQVIKDRFHWK
ncbi:Ankyrin repeat protein [Colletotrichum higginsianum IMI 349063]|uniref:Ankyrin repeat protein n=1 Tax=Colletotrichum higginsianum (strain IMI 349063) TaxID=759273 RepID=A0A1B7Y9Y6_COLHI|nr:Ankyrin repeat protein [Colletotrichum higginsianum IMI 349063]OBR08869.1 Ankyrin repeat protein [Colletotrichum higginsianum IMI 349063]